MKSLEARSFVATPADMEALTRDSIHAARTGKTVRGTYLKVLVATTRAELPAGVRKRAVALPKATEADAQGQVKAMTAVHKRLYACVLQVARDSKPRNAKEMNKWTNFARSAKAKLKKWLRAGNDIRSLVPAKVIHADLEVTKGTRAWTQDRFQRRTDAWTGHLVAAATAFAQEDKDTAVATLQAAIAQLGAVLTDLGATVTKGASAIVRDDRPVKAKGRWTERRASDIAKRAA